MKQFGIKYIISLVFVAASIVLAALQLYLLASLSCLIAFVHPDKQEHFLPKEKVINL
jgi:hypothetical protein